MRAGPAFKLAGGGVGVTGMVWKVCGRDWERLAQIGSSRSGCSAVTLAGEQDGSDLSGSSVGQEADSPAVEVPVRLLRVETGMLPDDASESGGSGAVLDYHVYGRVPRPWRKIEEGLRLDLWLAFRARVVSGAYDVIWAGSEKVAIPLTLLRPSRPMIVIAHHLESPGKARVLQRLGLVRKWAAVGYVADSSREFIRDYYGVGSDRLFQAMSAPIYRFWPEPPRHNGPVVALGVAKRDYATLIRAVGPLDGFETRIYCSSRYGDRLLDSVTGRLPRRVRIMPRVPDDAMPGVYRDARFVVIPLHDTSHAGAGASVFLEAAAAGKAVVATNTPGMASFITEGETGLLVRPGDVVGLRGAIQRLCDDPELADRLGAAARRLAEQRYHPQVVGAGVQAVLRRVAVESAGPGRERTCACVGVACDGSDRVAGEDGR